MYPSIPGGSPPPAYSPPANDSQEASADHPSPTLSELEIEAFGHRIAYLGPPRTIRAPTSPHSVIDVIDNAAATGRLSQEATPPSIPSTSATALTALSEPEQLPSTRTNKRRTTAAQAPIAPAPSEFELLIHVLQPDKRVRTGNRQKLVKVDSIKFGPISSPLNLEWESFQEVIADGVSCTPDQLVMSSLEWHFSKPQNSPWVPVKNTPGWTSLVKQVTAKVIKDPSVYVILRMQQPVPPRGPVLPWASSSNTAASIPREDEGSDTEASAPQGKKAKLDDVVEEIASKLEEKYPSGLCNDHPENQCFFHRVTNLHFDIGDRRRRLVWAAAIRRGDASYERIPLNSNFFKAEHSMKIQKTKAAKPSADEVITTNVEAPSTASLAPAIEGPSIPAAHPPVPQTPGPYQHPPLPQSASFNPYFPYPMPPGPYYSPYPAHPAPNVYAGMAWNPYNHATPIPGFPQQPPPNTATLTRRKRDFDSTRSSSPPIPDCDLHEFCEVYDLNATIENGLNELGFQMGDDLSTVTGNEWEQVGIKPLARRRLFKAYDKYKAESRR